MKTWQRNNAWYIYTVLVLIPLYFQTLHGQRKNAKYAEQGGHCIFIPVATETLGPFCVEGQSFIHEI
jgi:hypothetical protein